MDRLKILLDTKSHRIKDENGYLIVKNNPIALSGVFDYLASEIDDERKDKNTIVKVCRTFENLKENKDLFANKPIVWEHSWTGKDSKNQRADGAIGAEVEAKGGGLYADLIIYNNDLIKAIENNECKELSPGYECEVVKSKGSYNGDTYEYKQLLKNVNHLAVVENGRSGSELKIQDELPKGEKMAKETTFKKLLNNLKSILDEAKKEAEVKDDELDDDEAELTNEAEVKDDDKVKDNECEVKDDDKEVKDDEAETDENDNDEADDDEVIIKTDDETKKISDTLDKIINLKVDKLLKAERKKISDTQNAINEVSGIIGNFNTKSVKVADDAYKIGYQALSGKELKNGLDPKTAFEMLKEQNRSKFKVQDKAIDNSRIDSVLARFK